MGLQEVDDPTLIKKLFKLRCLDVNVLRNEIDAGRESQIKPASPGNVCKLSAGGILDTGDEYNTYINNYCSIKHEDNTDICNEDGTSKVVVPSSAKRTDDSGDDNDNDKDVEEISRYVGIIGIVSCMSCAVVMMFILTLKKG